MDEKLIAHHMRTLKCTREEAIQLIQDDKDVDRGIAKPWDLTKEQLKVSKQARKADSKPREKSTPRTRKENPAKRALIDAIAEKMREQANIASVEVSNAERTIELKSADGISYTVTLTEHRTTKK